MSGDDVMNGPGGNSRLPSNDYAEGQLKMPNIGDYNVSLKQIKNSNYKAS